MKKHTVLVTWSYYMTFEAKNEDDAVYQANEWATSLKKQDAENVLRQANIDVLPIEIED